MIQINLLPEEYRRADQTPLPLFLTIAIGLIAVTSLGGWYVKLLSSYQTIFEENERLSKEKKKWADDAAEVDAIIREINTMKKRQETIIDISRSKIMWSQKLNQLSQIFSEYGGFWIQSMSMNQSSLSGTLTVSAKALGSDASPVADFRERLREDTTFWYHFADIKNDRIIVVPASENEPEHLSFTLSLLLKGAPEGKKKKGRR